MNKVLMRPIFRIKYVKEQQKNKFKTGGIANVLHFQEGGLTKGERTALKLQPFVTALLGAQQRPGESSFAPVARAFGTGFAGLPENMKTIAAIDEANKPEDSFRILTAAEIAERNKQGENLDPKGTYQLNEASGEIKNLSKRELFADPFISAMSSPLAKDYTDTIAAGSTAQGKLGDLEILEAIVNNQDVTLGQFGPLSQRVQKFLVGLGADEKGLTDLTGAEVLQRFAGKSVLADLGQLKGALSEKELAFIQSLNIGVDTPREASIILIDLYKKATQRAIQKAKLYSDHVADFGSPLNKDSDGLTLQDKVNKLNENFTLLSPEIENRLRGLTDTTSASSSKFDRKIITANESNIDRIQKLFPNREIKIGDKFEYRESGSKKRPIFIPLD